MMKKQYINPETTIMLIDTQVQLMATGSKFSSPLKEEPVSDETPGFVQYSRVNSLWDDDEE